MREGKKEKKNQPSHWEGNQFSKRRLSLPKASLEVFTCGGWFSPLGKGPSARFPRKDCALLVLNPHRVGLRARSAKRSLKWSKCGHFYSS